jgi:multiple sugar transport system substrate-binding protein
MIFKIALFVIALFSVTSCKQKINSNPKEISFWHFQSEPKMKSALKELISKFELENNCKVITTELSWGDGKTKLIAAFNSRTPPDVLELGSDWIAQFSSSGSLNDISNQTEISKYVLSSQSPCFWNNKVYALPWYVDSRVIFYNKSLINDSLKVDSLFNWYSILNLCKKVKTKGIYGFGINGADPHRLYKKIIPMFWSNGGDIFENGSVVINSQQNIEALQMYVKLSENGIIENQRNLDKIFLQGKLAFVFSGGWLLDKIKKENPTLKFGIINIPPLNTGKGYSFAGGEYLALSATTNKSDLATKFINYITNGKTTLEYCKKEIGTVLPADSAFVNDKYFKSIPYMNYFINQLPLSKMTPVNPHWLDIEEVIESQVELALYKKKTAKQALNDAKIEIEALIR